MDYYKLKKISYVIIGIALLNVYSFMILHVAQGGTRLGPLTQPLLSFAEFPKTVASVFVEISKPEILVEKEAIEEINHLEYDLYAINGRYESSKWIIRLANLKNDKTIHEWYIRSSDYLKTDRQFSHSEPRCPIVLEDMSLVTANDESKNLFRIDKDSKVIWHNTDYQYHHAINKAADGNIWACTRNMYTNKRADIEYWDNAISKIDVETGKTLYHKSLTELFFENGYSYLIHGMSNKVSTEDDDPMHLNDIEPVMNDGPYWKKGDVFISLRHRSLIFLFRPSTNRIVRMIQGPFYHQHDVDIINDSTLSLFNNNISGLRNVNPYVYDNEVIEEDTSSINQYCGILTYNLADSSFAQVAEQRFKAEKLYTPTQGVHRILSNGDIFVECQNKGTIYLFNPTKTLIRKYYNGSAKDAVQRPHWIRIYETLDF